MSFSPLLEVKDLRVDFVTPHGTLHAVDGMTFDVTKGQILGIVGESGCGKSATAMTILGLNSTATITNGEVRFLGENLLEASEKRMQQLRGNRISMVFQDPMTSLNPVFTIGAQIAEVFQIHLSQPRALAMRNAIEMLELVDLPNPKENAKSYPHQLSGGMRQRVMIAMALAIKPDLLIADEPSTALDVTTQAQIMDLLKTMQAESQMSILFITHDLGLVAENCDHVIVMYAGVAVESAPAEDLFRNPRHPYTRGLLECVPSNSLTKRLQPIDGVIPNLVKLPKGCRFKDRCTRATDQCKHTQPPFREFLPGHKVRCFNPLEQKV